MSNHAETSAARSELEKFQTTSFDEIYKEYISLQTKINDAVCADSNSTNINFASVNKLWSDLHSIVRKTFSLNINPVDAHRFKLRALQDLIDPEVNNICLELIESLNADMVFYLSHVDEFAIEDRLGPRKIRHDS